ncbi:CoA transferase [Rhodospirillales bacterium]|jgi:crotonobetainyl-CoA:carnitine CoA-transferase CaiB-like acyl-CoA transferase|nr:CoA transferase [Rhodospirillales bacterium]
MPGPLEGIRVFDLTRILAGPSCTQMLGDLGADVIKIERAGAGDDTRNFAPPYIKDDEGNDTSEAAYFCAANRNKRSVTLDISKPEGQALAKRLIGTSQVLVENFKTGGLKKYGLSYDDLKDEFPGLIYCSITGFGQTGPYAMRPGYDVLIQGMSGLMSLNGDPDGEPMKAAIPVADLMAGMYAGVSINAALRHREITGEGQHIDIGMLDVMVSFTTIMGMNYLATGNNPPRLGNAHPNIVPYQAFETSDGAIILAVGNDGQFQRFCKVAECEELPANPDYATNGARLKNREQLVPIIKDIVKQKPMDFWLKELEANTVSCGPIYKLDQVFSNEHVLARDMKIEMEQPVTGAHVPLINSPIKMSGTPVTARMAPPTIGEHTDSVLQELLEMDEGELSKLREQGVI